MKKENTAQKYVLSSGFELIETDNHSNLGRKLAKIEDENVTKILNREVFVLHNKIKNCPLLITPVIKLFLEEFKSPTEVPAVTHKFAHEIGVAPQRIAPQIRRFLNDMLKRGILVSEKDAKKVKPVVTADARPAVAKVGSKIDNYRITKDLVTKSKVQIFVAKDTAKQRECVLKVLALPPHTDKKYRKRKARSFGQEFQLLSELQEHPAVCKFYEFVSHKKRPYAAMEYIKGVSLRKYLKKNKLTLADRLDLIRQVLSVTAHVHKCDILHGDLHSSNFLIEAGGRVRLIDFDLGNHRKLHKNEVHREGGVHEYIPPERINDSAFSVTDGRADFRSEVFQIGVILYFILYGKLPFKAFTWKQLAVKIKTETPDFATTTAAGEPIPTSIIDLIKKGMEKKRKRRFKSAKGFFKFFRREGRGESRERRAESKEQRAAIALNKVHLFGLESTPPVCPTPQPPNQ